MNSVALPTPTHKPTPTPLPLSIPPTLRARVALITARAGVLVALCGTAFSPPVANVGAFVALLAFAAVPDAWTRLRALWQAPVARAAALLLAVLTLALLWSDADWGQRLRALWGWRTLLLLGVGLAVFSTARSKWWVAALSVVMGAAGALWSLAAWHYQLKVIESAPLGTVLRNPSTQSMVFVAALTLALALATFKSKLRWVWIAAALVLAANLLFVTTGRSGQVAAAIVATTLTLTLAQGRLRRALLLALPFVVVAVVALSAVVQQRFSRGWHEMTAVQETTEMKYMGMRVVMWRNNLEVISEKPWWG